MTQMVCLWCHCFSLIIIGWVPARLKIIEDLQVEMKEAKPRHAAMAMISHHGNAD
jgi:hypothetical protein